MPPCLSSSPSDLSAKPADAEGKGRDLPWPGPKVPVPVPAVPIRVRATAAREPEAVAVQDAEARYSYAALLARADAIAARLTRAGVADGARVALCAPQSFDLIAAELAAMTVGAAYLPIDPQLPATRRSFLVSDAKAVLLMTGPGLTADDWPPDVEVLELSADGSHTSAPRHIPRPHDTAYVLYTSGSTGTPKGVEIVHSGLTNLVDWHLRRFSVRPGDRTSLVAGVGFDASVWELWPSLVAGATVVIAPADVRVSPERLRDWLVDQGIAVGFVPTVLAERLIRLPWPDEVRLRTLLTGGDTLQAGPPHGLPFALVNNYGPTECTVVATSAVVEPGAGAPPIGGPIDGVGVAVLDPAGSETPVGAIGELYLTGAGVARGYLHRPELTADRFVRLPDGRRAYRTGDLVLRRTDGSFDFRGRVDDQIQIRGQRVEPGEVAAALADHPDIAAAVVVPRPDRAGQPSLVGYYIPRSPEARPATSGLREHLGFRLPEYMIPPTFAAVDAFPTTPNGKLDPSALPDPHADEAHRVAPRSPREAALLAIWSEVLGHDAIGISDRFQLAGGNSLAAAQVDARIASRFALSPGNAATTMAITVADQALALTGSTPSVAPVRVQAGNDGPAPATAAQHRLWLLDQVAPHPTLYSNGLLFRLRGRLSVPALDHALQALAERHEILRTAFVAGPEGLRQAVRPVVSVPLEIADLRPLEVADRLRQGEQSKQQLLRRPFDLDRPPLLRALLLLLDDATSELLLSVHHIAVDGASVSIILDELAELYAAFTECRVPRLAELRLQLADVGRWEEVAGGGAARERSRSYWSDQFADPGTTTTLPPDRTRPARPAFRGATITRPLAKALYQRLTEPFGGGSTASLMLAALAAVLSRHTRQPDLVIGMPLAGRTRAELEPLIGCFVNTLPLRVRVERRSSFAQLAETASRALTGALAHQDLPFEQILGIAERAGTSSADLVRVLLVVQPPPAPARQLPAAELEFVAEAHTDTARFDLTVVLEHRADRPALSVEYDRDLFEEKSIAALADQIVMLLQHGLDDPDTSVGGLPLMSDAELRRTLALGTGETRDIGTRGVPALIDDTAHRRDLAPAVVCGRDVLSYRDLRRRSDVLADSLRRRVSAGTPVVVCLERSAASAVAMVAALKSGGIYIPLDPTHPDERLRHMLDEVPARALITSGSLQPRLAGLLGENTSTTLLVQPDGRSIGPAAAQLQPAPIGLADPAYAIYTSGSTGQPKCAVLDHRGLLNLALAKIARFEVRPDSRLFQFVSFGFGVSVADVGMTLIAGGTLVIRGPEPLAGSELAGLLRRERITHLVVPPSVLASLPADDLPDLGVVVVGGERCPADLVDRWAPGRTFVQAYGSTETSVCSATARCVPGGGRPPIGRPLPNVAVVVVDEDLKPVPAGMTGELLVSGHCVGRGYLGRPELTAARFLEDPTGLRPGQRCYRTGDLGRIRPDGQLELFGRDDDQLQLRGIRVESGEIEAALRAHPDVAEAAVAVAQHATAGQLLVGYVVLRAGAGFDQGALRAFLAARLPSGLVPATLLRLDSLPRTANGKLDRHSLPAPTARPGARTAEPPRTPTEQLLAQIWVDLLRPEDPSAIGIDDDFFTVLGGQSIVAAQLVARIRDMFEIPLPIRALYDAPTIAALARRVEAALLLDLDDDLVPENS